MYIACLACIVGFGGHLNAIEYPPIFIRYHTLWLIFVYCACSALILFVFIFLHMCISISFW